MLAVNIYTYSRSMYITPLCNGYPFKLVIANLCLIANKITSGTKRQNLGHGPTNCPREPYYTRSKWLKQKLFMLSKFWSKAAFVDRMDVAHSTSAWPPIMYQHVGVCPRWDEISNFKASSHHHAPPRPAIAAPRTILTCPLQYYRSNGNGSVGVVGRGVLCCYLLGRHYPCIAPGVPI